MINLLLFLQNTSEGGGTNYPGGMIGLILAHGGGKDNLQTYTGGMTGLLFMRGGGSSAGLSPAQESNHSEVRIAIGIML